MIYLIGGAPRCGKTTVARVLAHDAGIPLVSTDLLRGVLAPLLPDLRQAMVAGEFEREAELFYPHFAQTIAVARLQSDHTIIEGVGFQPHHVTRLRERFPNEISSCFLVRSSVEPAEIFSQPQDHRIYRDLSEDEKEDLVAGIREWSAAILEDSAAAHKITIDLANSSLDQALSAARRILGL